MVRTMRSAVLVAGVAAAAVLGTAGLAAASSDLNATLSGSSEVPAGDPDGRGSGRITLNAAKGRVCYSATLSKVGTVTAGHIHQGAKGKAGPVRVSLFATPTKRPKGCVNGVPKSLIRAIARNPRSYYLNLHNASYPAGAVRGQLRG